MSKFNNMVIAVHKKEIRKLKMKRRAAGSRLPNIRSVYCTSGVPDCDPTRDDVLPRADLSHDYVCGPVFFVCVQHSVCSSRRGWHCVDLQRIWGQIQVLDILVLCKLSCLVSHKVDHCIILEYPFFAHLRRNAPWQRQPRANWKTYLTIIYDTLCILQRHDAFCQFISISNFFTLDHPWKIPFYFDDVIPNNRTPRLERE